MELSFEGPVVGGRQFSLIRQILLSDTNPTGLLRMDAISRLLQDAATQDIVESGISDEAGGWILRSLEVAIKRPVNYLDTLSISTWCSGISRSWAQRRTQISLDGEAVIEAQAIWVQVNASTGFPMTLSDKFWEIYGPSAGDKKVSARPRLKRPLPAEYEMVQIPLRYSDLDVMGHLNNAIHTSFLEEVLASTATETNRSGRRPTAWRIEFFEETSPTIPVSIYWTTENGTLSGWMKQGEKLCAAAEVELA